MCFEIIKLPGFLAEKKEYEVELPFLSRIVAYPDLVNTDESKNDGRILWQGPGRIFIQTPRPKDPGLHPDPDRRLYSEAV